MNVEAYSERLVELSLETLPRMLVPEKNLLCRELGVGKMVPRYDSEKSARYTIMSLLGILRAERDGHHSGLDVGRIYDALTGSQDGLTIGDCGLLLWLSHRRNAPNSREILTRIEESTSNLNWDGIITVELAWLIVGLSAHVCERDGEGDDLCQRIVGYTLDNRSSNSGLFYHKGSGFRRRFPNFATQIYTLHALSRRARLAKDERCSQRAILLAKALATLQREDGGWPWIYDAAKGLVVEPFEIYSVHQDGMAPMAFHELSEATGFEASAIVERGLRWMDKGNALTEDMIDSKSGLIYRSIRRKAPGDRLWLYARTACSSMGLTLSQRARQQSLEVNRTCRPYHLGWVLEAWCDRKPRTDEEKRP